MTGEVWIALVGYLAGGGVVGVLYFYMLHRTVKALIAGDAGMGVMALYGLRVLLALAAAWFAVQQSAFGLLFGLAGFLLARQGVKRWGGGEG